MPGGDGPRSLSAVSHDELGRALAGPGLLLDYGLVSLRVCSDLPLLAAQLRAVYPHFPFTPAGDWADLHVDILQARGLRRWWRPQVVFQADNARPFSPFPADSPLPLMEWGTNWLVGRRCHTQLLLHAGAVERSGAALLMPATPGSGKSTLTAALAQRGWRLLSDEFGALSTVDGQVRPLLKPVALKNESIGVISAWSADAVLGPQFPGTRKGTVAHLAARADAVARVHEPALAGAVVLPRFSAGSATHWQRVGPETVFRALAFNAFNYALMAEDGFNAVVRVARECPAWELVYGDLHDAVARLDAEWPAVAAAAHERAAQGL